MSDMMVAQKIPKLYNISLDMKNSNQHNNDNNSVYCIYNTCLGLEFYKII